MLIYLSEIPMIKLLLADDHRIFRQGLNRLLVDHQDMVIVAEAADHESARNAIRNHDLDVAIVDLSMPGRGGIDLISFAKSVKPKLRVLVLTMHDEDHFVEQSLRAGADGYITKETAADELRQAILRIFQGGRYVSAPVAERIALGMFSHVNGEKRHESLSVREFKIFEMLVAGKRGNEIANELSLSEKTVSTHKIHVLKKMNLTNRTELILYAIRNNLVPA
jgi:DNA-binding NarL/FixJ family response regulator